MSHFIKKEKAAKMSQLLRRFSCTTSFLLLFCAVAVPSLTVHASTYSSGTYSSCQYNTCGISLTSNGTVSVNVLPTSSGSCTIQSDSVAVMTDSSTGYTLTLNDTDTSNQMSGSNGGIINPGSGTNASPAVLTANTWGYRVDSNGGFGAGPTTAASNVGIPSSTFAAVPLSSATPDTIASSTVAADPAVTTPVWYGLCADTTIPSGTYSDNVTYTAVVN
jgi:hypothetical protein